MRLPNLFTAISDPLAGYLLAQGPGWTIRPGELVGLLASSACFYAAGVVLNDVNDLPRDRLYRPERPLPSGRISVRLAWRLGLVLLGVGWGLSAILSVLGATGWPMALGTVLAAVILSYDFALKSTGVGFLLMGACRSLNLFLGVSVGHAAHGHPFEAGASWAALALGVYVAGITLFASREEHNPTRRELVRGLVLIAGALGMLAILPVFESSIEPVATRWPQWVALVVVLGWILGVRGFQALRRPSAALVQQFVKQAILWIIIWDATICFAFAGGQAAILVLSLLVPAVLLGLRIRLT
ncbi:MAG: UbiA family prenyltransferase [Thermoguttaceae bacterium]|nr:UbiA family prenyltransferase [Thermoguttaceae bacterium]